MRAISSYRGNRPTNTATNPQTEQDRLQYTAPQLGRSIIMTRLGVMSTRTYSRPAFFNLLSF